MAALPPPPYERVTVLRSDDQHPPRVSRNVHPRSVVAVLNGGPPFEPILLDPLIVVST